MLEKINSLVFPSGHNKLVGRDVVSYAGSPNTALTGTRVGQLCYDTTNDDGYICTALPTTWVKLHA